MIVIGIGNRDRQDDAAGLLAAARLRSSVPPNISVVEHEGDPLDLLAVWAGHDLAILIDALNLPGEAGKIRRLDPEVDAPPRRESIVSSHGHSLWDALELANVLDQRPTSTLIFAISGAKFGFGHDMSPEVERAIEEAEQSVLETIRQSNPHPTNQ